MKPALFERKENRITDLTTKEVATFTSTNKAKFMSRELQKNRDGGLGRGSVRVQK